MRARAYLLRGRVGVHPFGGVVLCSPGETELLRGFVRAELEAYARASGEGITWTLQPVPIGWDMPPVSSRSAPPVGRDAIGVRCPAAKTAAGQSSSWWRRVLAWWRGDDA